MTSTEKKENGLTSTISHFIAETEMGDIPQDNYTHAKVAFLDWMAVLLAGKDEPLVKKLIDYAKGMGGREQATVIGHAWQTNVIQAALINGSASHALDFDDTMQIFMGHPTVTLYPALVSLAEWQQKSGSDLLTSYIVALQVGATVASCAGVQHYLSGWHGTSTIGRIASAAGCAKLLGLNEQQTTYALGIAATQSSGLKRVFGTMTKPFHAGKAAQVGLEAALLAAEEFTCADDILEGPDGFFQLLQGGVNNEALDFLGKRWVTDKLAQKYHASCHGTHSPIEAVLDLVEKEKISITDMQSIKTIVTQTSCDVAGKTDPQTGLEGKFSIPYCVANALVTGDTGTEAFTDEKVGDADVRDLMNKISLEVMEDRIGMEATVQVITTAGNVYESFSDVLNEIPDLNTKQQKVKNKFMNLCSHILGETNAGQVVEAVLALEAETNVSSLIEKLDVNLANGD
jgi:2-methylcitrate dehydratase PrpD